MAHGECPDGAAAGAGPVPAPLLLGSLRCRAQGNLASSLVLAGFYCTRFLLQADRGLSANEPLLGYPFLIHQTLLLAEEGYLPEGSLRCAG